jgi:hypothetical protein
MSLASWLLFAVLVVLAAIAYSCIAAWEADEKSRREYRNLLDDLRTRRERRKDAK